MNKHLLILAIALAILSPLMASKWKTYTNTTHVNDFIEVNNKLYMATWGGLAAYNHDTQLTGSDAYELDHIYNNIDGLSNNDVRVLDYIPSTNNIWIGLYAGGINILSPSGIKIVNETSGLPSDKITGIVHTDSLFFVSTDAGLAVFYQLAHVSFPLLNQTYSNSSTLGGLVSNNITSMKLSDSKYLFLGTTSGLSYVHIDSLSYNASWHTLSTSNSLIPGDQIIQLALYNNQLAVSTSSGLGILDLESQPIRWTNYTTANGLLSNSTYAVQYSDTGDLYFSYGSWDENIMTLTNPTNTVLNKLADGIITTFTGGASGLDNTAITRIGKINGKLAISSWGDGLYVLNNTNWFNIKTNSIGFNTVSCITNSKDKMWFGSGNLDANKTRKGTRGMSSFDGTTWTTYNVQNSPILSDNTLTIAVDDQDRIWSGSFYAVQPNDYGWENGMNIFDQESNSWKKITQLGLSQYNPSSGEYDFVSDSPRILSSSLSYIYRDSQNRMFICCYNGGVVVMNSALQVVRNFQLADSPNQGVILVAEADSTYFFGTANDFGLTYWPNKSQLTSDTNLSWEFPSPPELRGCWVYGVVSFINDFGENEVWIAASNGIFSYNGTNWFKYDVDVKRRIYSNGAWVNDVNGLYFVDEDRLFGSVHTTPTAIFLDPFRRVWLGSGDNGFSMYDTTTERFTNYNISNSPLISNHIISFGYDNSTGSLFIGTPDGLNSLQIGFAKPPQAIIDKVRVFPNPFRPDQGQKVTLENTMPTGTFPSGKNICRIYDISGDFVAELKENLFLSFTWNGLNAKGKKCSSGVYYYVITTHAGFTEKGKIALIRG